jgi:hypothetical protein
MLDHVWTIERTHVDHENIPTLYGVFESFGAADKEIERLIAVDDSHETSRYARNLVISVYSTKRKYYISCYDIKS